MVEMYEFDFEKDLQENGYNVTYGPRGSGKTTLTRLILQKVSNAFTAQWVFFVGTENVKKLYRSISHPFYVRDPTKNALKELLDLQKWKVELCNLYKVPFPPQWKLNIVCDDCGAFAWFLRGESVKEIAVNGRNNFITFYAIIQKFEQLNPDTRENVSTYISLKTQIESVITKIRKNYCAAMKQKQFLEVFLDATSKRRALCIKCTDDPNEEHNLFYTHCALLHPDGFEAAANQEEIDAFNNARAKKGRPLKIYNPANMLKRLGHQIHEDVANENFRPPTIESMMTSNKLMKFMFANSMGTPISDQKPRKRRTSIVSEVKEVEEKEDKEEHKLENDEDSDDDACKEDDDDEIYDEDLVARSNVVTSVQGEIKLLGKRQQKPQESTLKPKTTKKHSIKK